MSNCECLPKCPFFNDKMKGMDTLKNMMKSRYCKGDNAKCARYMVFKTLGSQHVPLTLFPNMLDRAKNIIDSRKSQKI